MIPRFVRRPDGTTAACDDELTELLLAASRTMGHVPIDAPLLTNGTIVHGRARNEWAARGYAAADMETGLIRSDRLACVRVILDTPSQELAPQWARPISVLWYPSAWRDFPFLAREGPRCAGLAAAILARALDSSAAR